jgi:hypothetical protein
VAVVQTELIIGSASEIKPLDRYGNGKTRIEFMLNRSNKHICALGKKYPFIVTSSVTPRRRPVAATGRRQRDSLIQSVKKITNLIIGGQSTRSIAGHGQIHFFEFDQLVGVLD